MQTKKLSRVTITLIWDHMGHPRLERQFLNQTISILPGETIKQMGVDGHLSIGYTAHKVEWENGDLNDLDGATEVSVKDGDDRLVFRGELSWNQPPQGTHNAVRFWINPVA